MFQKMKMGEKPITMTVMAQAVWNEEEGFWEVTITQSETGIVFPSREYSFWQNTHQVKVRDCNEVVIADALLHANGISMQKCFDLSYNPIVE